MRQVLGLVTAGLLGACFSPTFEARLEPGDTSVDPVDAGKARADTGQPRSDGGTGRQDAGPSTDGGTGRQDAGPSTDGGRPTDAGTPVDAGCRPRCGERACGDDGCGGLCGECPPQTVCTASGRCELPDPCAGVVCSSVTPRCVVVAGVPQCQCTQDSCGVGATCQKDHCEPLCMPPCGGETPVCDPVARSCRCTATSCKNGWICQKDHCEPECSLTCSGETPYCVLVGQVPQCQCGPQSCASGRGCVAGVCRSLCPPCSKETPTCDGTTGQCVCIPGSCTGGTCLNGKCRYLACSPCSGETPACDFSTNQCTCTPTSCGPGRSCLGGECRDSTCSSPCAGATPQCDPVTRTCRCTATSCPSGQQCDSQGMCRVSGWCDPLAQTGCFLAQGCYFDAAMGAVCLPAGNAADGSACTSNDQCLPGSGCHSGVCRRYCDPVTGLGCGLGTQCAELAPGLGVCEACTIACFGRCCPSGWRCEANGCVLGAVCDPLIPVCPAGEGCYLGRGAEFGCAPAGNLPAGSACSTHDECQPGTGCFSDGLSKRCDRFCGPGRACTGGDLCLPLFSGLGICVPCTRAGVCGTACCLTGQTCNAATSNCALGGNCNPLQSSCPQGQGCYFDYVAIGYFCLGSGRTPDGSSCFFDWECRPGSGCLGPNFDVCAPYCNPQAPACGPGKVCQEVGDGYGWCG